MATPAEPAFDRPPTAHELRMRYRCSMCHKQCFIPCRLTATEFRRLAEESVDGPPSAGPSVGP